MGRLPDINEATLSSHQRRVYDEIIRVRGQVRGPFAVGCAIPSWLNTRLSCRICLPHE